MSHEIDTIKNTILVRGTDDWVHDAEACYAAREAVFGARMFEEFPEDATLAAEETATQERQVFPLALDAVKGLLRDGLVQIGSLGDNGFQAWEDSPQELEARIDQLVEAARFPLMPGDLFWLSNTPMGDEKAAA